MQSKISHKVTTDAYIEDVWKFLMDPESVAQCMPGTRLEEVINDRCFVGSIDIKLGFVTVRYRVQAELVDIDLETRTIAITATGADANDGDGRMQGNLKSNLKSLTEGGTEIHVDVSMNLSGRLIQFGSGMIRSVTKQLTKKFFTCMTQKLESQI